MKKKWGIKSLISTLFSAAFILVFLVITGTPSSTLAKSESDAKGSYHLVGTGPGDADLLTVRALNIINAADVIFSNSKRKEQLEQHIDFDGKEILEGYERLFPFYGKDCSQLTEEEKSGERMSCEEYHQKQAEFANLVRKAVADGKNVVMLSGGDPTIFGPSTWTIKELADINPVVVPGLSAFNAAHAALKVGLGEIIITAPFQREGRKDTLESFAGHDRATMVIFMPRDFQDVFGRLSKVYPENTPVAVVSYAGHSDKEKAVTGTIGDIEKKLDGLDVRMSIIYLGNALEKAQLVHNGENKADEKGKFYLVGIGPGDSDLATLRAMRVIEKADLVFAGTRIKDRFVPLLEEKKVLEDYGRVFPFYGKDCSKVTEEEKAREQMSCEEYQEKQREFAAIVREAVSQGKTVAMLDNGDPLIYGPCSWSLIELSDLNTEVVPGLSAFNAANAALGKDVTKGTNSNSVILASGWSVEEMAVHQATMVLFTMRTEFKKFIDSLSEHYSPETTVALVISAGYADKEKVMHSTVGNVLQQLGEDKLPFEYLLYVGDFLIGKEVVMPKEKL
jgi:precorrin-4 methylase